MGALFWQLNDCWPVASWSSMDYYGNWKALQYYAKRFYADLLLSPWRHDGRIEVYVVSDKLAPTTGEIRARLMDFRGNVLAQNTRAVQIANQSSAMAETFSEREWLGHADPRQTFLTLDLIVGGDVVSRNTVFFAETRDLELPSRPAISTELTGTDGAYKLVLHSTQLARHVFLSFGDLDAQLSDNYVDLLPNEPVAIEIRSTATLDQLKTRMQLMHLMQAFNSNTANGVQ